MKNEIHTIKNLKELKKNIEVKPEIHINAKDKRKVMFFSNPSFVNHEKMMDNLESCQKDIPAYYIDVLSEEGREIAIKMQLYTFPALLIFEEDGTIAHQNYGVVKIDDINFFLEV